MVQERPDTEWIDRLAPKVAELQNALQGTPAEAIAERSGAVLDDQSLHLSMLFDPYSIDIETFAVRQAGGAEAGSFIQALVLTYLRTADGTPEAGRWVSFRELPNGAFYHQAFQGYAANRLVKRWGSDLGGFQAACRSLNGEALDLGDAGYALRVLPRVDLAAVYWLGDEDLPSRASVLFDAHAPHYMVSDGLAILGSRLVDQILR
jgi:hypothetical protein